MITFLSDERGAAADWVALAVGIVLLGIVVMYSVKFDGMSSLMVVEINHTDYFEEIDYRTILNDD